MRLTSHVTLMADAAAIEAADTDTRVLAGIAVPYGQVGHTSVGALTIDAGAIAVPERLASVKLFREHGRNAPVGYAVDATDARDALRMRFRVAATPDGDQALLEASEGLRDSLSVELANVEVTAGHVTAADLVGVAQVAVPAFAGAILTAALTDEQQADVNALAKDIVAATDPEDTDEPTEETPEETATMQEPTVQSSRPVGMVPARTTSAPSRTMVASAMAQALTGARDAAEVNAALADITPVSAATDGLFPRPSWLGELWTPRAASRPLVDAIGVSPLTAMEMQGWKWVTEPEVAPYAGNKAAIPTSPAVVAPASAPAHRIAGGWDLDRIYLDFNTGFMEAFQSAAVRDYAKKSQTYFINGHGAITGPPAIAAADGFLADATDLGASADLVAAVQAVVGFLTGNGATVSFIAMASDAYQDFLNLTSADAPFWLAGNSAINLNGNITVGSSAIVVEPALPAGTVLGGDRDAVSLWETGPINVNAVNLPNGGVDYGLFGYWAQLVHDDDGLAKTTVAGVTTAGARKASSSKSDKS